MEIPTFTNHVGVAVYQGPRQDPGAAAAPGQALARVGAEATDLALSFEERYQKARQQADASNAIAKATDQLNELQFNLSKTPDRQKAMELFDQGSAAIKKGTLAGISDPVVSRFVEQNLDREAGLRKQDTGNAAFQAESQMRRGDLANNLSNYAKSAATATNPLLRSKITDDAVGTIRGAVAAGWLNAEAGARAELAFKSDVQENQVLQAFNDVAIAGDTDKAETLIGTLSDPNNFTDLAPEKREAFVSRAEAMSYRLMQRDAAAAAKADTLAARALRQTQTENETRLLTDIHTGKNVDPTEIERLAYTDQLSAEGVRSIYSAIDNRNQGKDEPLFTVRLWHSVTEKTASPDDIYAAVNTHRIRTETGTEMIRALATRDKQSVDQVERGRYNELKTALSGAAVEAGVFRDTAPQTMKWQQAQGEWNRRVLTGGEDPTNVLHDMLPRYQTGAPALEALPRPRLGAIATPQDVNAVGAATLRALQSRKIDQATYDEEVGLLNKYRAFFLDQQQRQQQQPKAPAK